MYDSILVATDGSEHADRAYERGLTLAEKCDAELHVQHVVDTNRHPETALSGSQLVVSDAETTGQRVLKECASAAKGRGIGVTTRNCHGDPGEEILTYADEHDVDLLVMGFQGEDHERALGTTASQIVKSMDRPTMLV